MTLLHVFVYVQNMHFIFMQWNMISGGIDSNYFCSLLVLSLVFFFLHCCCFQLRSMILGNAYYRYKLLPVMDGLFSLHPFRLKAASDSFTKLVFER